MKNSNLLQLLGTLSRQEVRELRKWLVSPAHNQRQDVQKLFDYVMEENALTDPEYLSKEDIFSHLFPREAYDDARMRQTMHFLMKIVEQFIIYQRLCQDEVRNKVFLARTYRQRKLDKLFLKTIADAEQEQRKTAVQDENYLLNEYYIQREHIEYLDDKLKNNPPQLKAIAGSLDEAFIAAKLKQSCMLLSWLSVYKLEYQVDFLEEVLAYTERRQLYRIPAIGMYYYIYKTITDRDDETHFGQLKQFIAQHRMHFEVSEQREIYLAAINYCIAKFNVGNTSFIREAFDLYRDGFDNNLFVENNSLSTYTFRNAIAFALKLKELDWAEQFIHRYQHYIPREQRNDFVLFNLANLYYERHEYDKAMRLFSQVEFNSVLINLSAKSYLIRMLYEQDELPVLESLLDSVQSYLRRKEILGYHKEPYKNFIKLTKKLLKAYAYNPHQRKKLREEIEVTTPLNGREWLLEQLDLL